MKNHRNYFFVPMTFSALLITFSIATFGQKSDNGNTENAAAIKTVNARQDGDWNVGISNTSSNPIPVQIVSNGGGRKAFQARVAVGPQGTGFQTAHLTIPAGKRLVIENVSAVARRPQGLQMEMQYFTYLDNGDGIGNSSDITFHRITLAEQGTFDGTAISTANHKVLVFADERIGTAQFSVGFQARLNGTTTGFTNAQITFSGYLEDLPLQ